MNCFLFGGMGECEMSGARLLKAHCHWAHGSMGDSGSKCLLPNLQVYFLFQHEEKKYKFVKQRTV